MTEREEGESDLLSLKNSYLESSALLFSQLALTDVRQDSCGEFG